ncbi:hypothetical protein WOLCODRAFT_157954 [Wolfiporia cocos MD-104 SS10]|uniref:Uncharacterized protein n=1 Tax=Wolfiporia cocos (strain MD-104) TaxID=742152 RepID=A0A2H3JET4_WOLCO|nr:hypothetical protein WOLCODRAFT_157954 [Wolfiporia cocos MD-104 SS10]
MPMDIIGKPEPENPLVNWLATFEDEEMSTFLPTAYAHSASVAGAAQRHPSGMARQADEHAMM